MRKALLLLALSCGLCGAFCVLCRWFWFPGRSFVPVFRAVRVALVFSCFSSPEGADPKTQLLRRQPITAFVGLVVWWARWSGTPFFGRFSSSLFLSSGSSDPTTSRPDVKRQRYISVSELGRLDPSACSRSGSRRGSVTDPASPSSTRSASEFFVRQLPFRSKTVASGSSGHVPDRIARCSNDSNV